MNFKTNSGNLMSIDLEKWSITNNSTCKILREEDDSYILENESKQIVKISKSIIYDNHLAIIDNHIDLSEGVYEQYFLNNIRAESNKRMNDIFNQHIELIFSNREIVLRKAEYFLLRPAYLSSGGAYVGEFSYSLGALIESFQSGKHIFFEELSGFKKLYLINVHGSPLSGSFEASFWSDEDGKIINLNSGNGNSLPMSFPMILKEFKSIISDPDITIDFQDKAIEGLVNEISRLNR